MRIEAAGGNPGVAIYVLLAREAVEAACVEVMDLAERAIGTAAHGTAHPVDRMCRDLRFYLRQAALDDKLARAGMRLGRDRILPRDL